MALALNGGIVFFDHVFSNIEYLLRRSQTYSRTVQASTRITLDHD
jgi:hypothetical protein